MKTIKKTLIVTGKLFLGIVALLLIYCISAFSLSRITVNEDLPQSDEVTIYLQTNGVHTDLLLPVRNEIKDWSQSIKFESTPANDTTATHIAFGWGDKGFYLNTPEWSDLKASTAFNAAFGLGGSAMHTTFCKAIKEDKSCVKIMLSSDNYQKLIAYIEQGFQIDATGNPICITGAGYGKNDSFYEANGSYSMFQTCNSWTNGALKASNQKAALWAVTDTGIFCHYTE